MHNETFYKCECGAEDHDRAVYENSPAALVCWRCKDGSRMSVAQQVAAQAGMLPVKNPSNGE